MKKIALGIVLIMLPLMLAGCVTVRWDDSTGWGRSGSRSERIEGSGSRDSRSYTVESFDRVEIGMLDTRLYLTQGDEYALTIEMDSNLFDYLNVTCKDSHLEIDTGRYWLTPNLRADVYITAPSFSRLDIAGGVEFSGETTLTGDRLRIDVAGATSGTLDVRYEEVDIDLAGAGDLRLSGSATTLKADVAGAADINAKDCVTRDCRVSIAGAGSMKVHCTEELSVEIAGFGSLTYYGNPRTVDKSIAGLGTVTPGE